MVIPMIVVPVEPAPRVASASMKPASEKAMLQLQLSYDPHLENFVAGSVLGASDLMTNVSVVDQYIHEPR